MNPLFIALGVVIIATIALWFLARHLIWFGVNSIIGVFALMGWNELFTPVVINIWSVVLVAVFGLAGLLLVVALHALHMAF